MQVHYKISFVLSDSIKTTLTFSNQTVHSKLEKRKGSQHSDEDRNVFLKQMQYSYISLMLPGSRRKRRAREAKLTDWGEG